MRSQTSVPDSVKDLSTELQRLIRKYEVENYSIYISGPATPYGIVWVNGNNNMVLSGIHVMIQVMAEELGKTEAEIARMILSSRYKKV